MKSYRKHVLVCCTEGCCGARGGEAVFDALQAELTRRSISDVLPSKTLCSGACPKHGATVIVHPDGLWYEVTKPEEVREIVAQHLIEGGRLRRNGESVLWNGHSRWGLEEKGGLILSECGGFLGNQILRVLLMAGAGG